MLAVAGLLVDLVAGNAAGNGHAGNFTTAYFHTPRPGRRDRTGWFHRHGRLRAEGPGWPLRQERADPQRREQILFAARSVETQPSLTGFSNHLIAAATKP
jgi:hypothetical protein